MITKIKMKQIQNNIDVQVKNTMKNVTNVIEWNVDMKVTISNVKKSKMFQRSQSIALFLLIIIFIVIFSHLKKEVRGLQVQMQCVNVNLLLLMSKYDRLNRSLNRAWIRRSEKFFENKNMHNVKEPLEEALLKTKTVELFNGVRSAISATSYAYNSIVPNLRMKKKHVLYNDTYNHNIVTGKNYPIASESLMKSENSGNLRVEREILTLEKQNITEKHTQLNITKIMRHKNNDYHLNDDLDVRREPRAGRWRRDEGRGKKPGKNKRRPKRSRRRLDPLVATFVGAIPEQHITDTVYIGPWVKSTKNNTLYSLNKFHLVEDKKSIEVTMTGLYMISAQIFYFGEPTNYSYWILLSSEGKSTTRKLVKCSTASSISATEVSCYTSVTTPLQRGDRVHIQQQERNRFINMREGYSYVQLILLSNKINYKGRLH